MLKIEATPYERRTRGKKMIAVFTLLGFYSVEHFSAYAGIAYQTCSEVFSENPKYPQKFTVIARVYEALKSAYENKMSPAEKRFVRAWANEWIDRILKNVDKHIMIERHGRRTPAPSRSVLNQRNKRIDERIAKYVKILEKFK